MSSAETIFMLSHITCDNLCQFIFFFKYKKILSLIIHDYIHIYTKQNKSIDEDESSSKISK